MTPQHVISELLKTDSKYPHNLDLLKKIIITVQLGRLQINGLPPDNKISLANYLFDNENVMFDFTRLSEEKRKLFTQWLLKPHQEEKTKAHFRGAWINEYRGFTAESFLSWWGRIKSWLNKKYSDYWKITDATISLNYQLTGVELCHGKQGILIGFDQFLAPSTGTKYHDPNDSQNEPLGNTKRVYITDQLVEQLTCIDIKEFEFESICKKPHPHSIEVRDSQARLDKMYEYRKTQRFLALKPWYIRIWSWFFPSLQEEKKSTPISNNEPVILYQSDHIQIERLSKTHEILVTEKRPEIDDIVFCGGGAKIFGHVGFWKALNEAKIHPTKFAGSSAGAIMALLCYLGYTAGEITELFKNFRQEHLVHFDLNINGMSDPGSLKTALDYAVAYKLEQIVIKYKIPYPQGKITFATLEAIRQQCPDCGLGKELIVTATNKKLSKTRYFSLQRSPNFEVTEAVKMSASFPIVYRPTIIDGEEYSDGGNLSNLPAEAFMDDHTTLLESEYGNNLKAVVVQFDNGTERTAIDHIMERVYKENFFANWIYSIITGVNDPASGWEQDRLKLRKYSSQSIVINVGNISSSSFSVDEESRNKMIQSGYDETMNYLNIRYIKSEDGTYENDELMHTKFDSLIDLLAYCCYRGNKFWFEKVNELIANSTDLVNKTEHMQQSAELRELYFNKSPLLTKPNSEHTITFFGNSITHEPLSPVRLEHHKILLALYPVFLKLVPELLKDSTDKKFFDAARHSYTLNAPFACLTHFKKITKPVNIVFHLVLNLIIGLQDNLSQQDKNVLNTEDAAEEFNKLLVGFDSILKLLQTDVAIYKDEFYANWNLTLQQSLRALNVLNSQQTLSIQQLLNSFRLGQEPMQVVISGEFCEDSSLCAMDENSQTCLTV